MPWTTPTVADVLSGFLPAERAAVIKLFGSIAGTVAANNGYAAFVGTGTAFTTLSAGQTILVNGVAVTIQAVADDTHFTATAPWAGLTASGLPLAPTDALAAIIARVVAKIRGSVRSGGYDLADDVTTIPGDLFDEFVAMAVWRYVTSMPGTTLATDGRKEADQAALKKLADTDNQQYVPEPPTAGSVDRGGSWNSENKLIPRTHPVPTPGSQSGSTAPNPYANPDAPADLT